MSTAQPALFGTDGVRGVPGEYPLDQATVVELGRELGRWLADRRPDPLVVLGGDTRDSTPALAAWLGAGLSSAGARLRFAGVLPTPGVAHLVRRLGADAGVAVSASHNPHPDNGIKLFDAVGAKWPTRDEAALERRLRSAAPAECRPVSPLEIDLDLHREYLEDLLATLPGDAALAGLELIVDAANGAASPYAGELFRRAGARVTLLNATPDGRNINCGCGSTHPGGMAERVRHDRAHLGIAFDGDADRAILADERGEVRDGDAMLYLWATALRRAGQLDPPAIVATSMSNLGLERALGRVGIRVVRCDVGDRAVVEAMRREGVVLGGEQSGHLVHRGLGTTGDGLLTALQLAALVVAAQRPLSALLVDFCRYPQLLRNVRVARKPDLAGLPAVIGAARRVEQRLGGDGRLVLRYSGTEPLARIMIEGPEQGLIEALAEDLAAAIEREIGQAAAPAGRESR